MSSHNVLYMVHSQHLDEWAGLHYFIIPSSLEPESIFLVPITVLGIKSADNKGLLNEWTNELAIGHDWAKLLEIKEKNIQI